MLRIARWDVAARIAHGRDAPVKFQRLWVDPSAIAHKLAFEATGRAGRTTRRVEIAALKRRTPTVLGGEWDLLAEPLGGRRSVNALVRRRIADNASWDAVGETRRMEKVLAREGLRGTEAAAILAARHHALDALIEHVRSGGEILPQSSLRRGAFREKGGIEVAIDREGRFLRVGDGNHRLAIAQHFGLPRIPVCLIVVHAACVASGHFHRILVESERLRRLAPPGTLVR